MNSKASIALAALMSLSAGALPGQTTFTQPGLVTDIAGKPLEGDVQIVTTGAKGTQIRTAQCDASGRFRASLTSGQRTVLVAKANGYISAERVVDVPLGEIRFTLREAIMVSGKVIGPNGNAIPMAKIRVRYPNEVRLFRFGQETDPVAADAAGMFELPFVAKDVPFIVDGYSDDHAPSSTAALRAPGALKDVTVVLRRKAQSITAIVKRAGVPAPNVPVRLLATGDSDDYSDDDKRGLAFQSRTYQTQLSGTDGTVEFRGVPLGRFRLAVPGRAPIEAPSASNAANGNRVIPIDVP